MSALLEVRGLTRRFGGLVAVDGLSFSLAERETVGLLGPNGSGKSTVMNLVSGALSPSAGSVRLRGLDITGASPDRVARAGVGRTFQLVRVLSSLSVLDNVRLALAFGPDRLWGAECDRRARHHLDEVGLGGRGGERATALTYIDQKRLELARALAGKPSVLLLDEWFAGLNPTELALATRLIGSLRERGIAILLVEHIIEAVRELCPRCIVLAAGRRIADGPTDEVLAEPEVLRSYLGDADA